MKFCLIVAALGVSAAALAGPVEITYQKPSLDRWMYAFNGTPGSEFKASAFAALNLPGFDDRDGQILIGFSTAGEIAPGQGKDAYSVSRARVRVRIVNDLKFVYDPTWDSVRTSYDPSDPEYLPDEDGGKPFELFGAGYRNGWTATTFQENSVFGGEPLIPPAEGARNVFTASFDEGGNATDVSRQVRLRFEAQPMAIGTTTAVEPGQKVPLDAEFVFELDVCDPLTQTYLRDALNTGVLNVVISSLVPATDPGSTDFPAIYTKENPAGQALKYEAKLDISANSGVRSDFNADGTLDIDDFIAFQTAFGLGDPAADVDGSCSLDIDDFVAFQVLFALGK